MLKFAYVPIIICSVLKTGHVDMTVMFVLSVVQC